MIGIVSMSGKYGTMYHGFLCTSAKYPFWKEHSARSADCRRHHPSIKNMGVPHRRLDCATAHQLLLDEFSSMNSGERSRMFLRNAGDERNHVDRGHTIGRIGNPMR